MKPTRRPVTSLAVAAILVLLLLATGTGSHAQGTPEPGGPPQKAPDVTASPTSPGTPGEARPEGPDSPAPVASPTGKAPSPEPSSARISSPKPRPKTKSPAPGASPTGASSPTLTVDDDGMAERPGGKPVKVLGRDAFRLYLTSKTFPLDKRVEGITRRLNLLMQKTDLDLDGFKVVDDPKTTGAAVLYHDRFLFAIMPQDTPFEGVSPNLFALRYVETLRAIYREAATQRAQALRDRAMTVGLQGLVAFPLCLLLCFYLLRLVEGRVHALEGRILKPLKIHQAVLLDSQAISSAIIFVFRFAVFVALAVAFSVFLDYFLSFFPGTADLRKTLLAAPLGLINESATSMIRYLPNLLFLVVCIFLVRFLLGLTDTVFLAMESGAIVVNAAYRDFLAIYRKMVRVVVMFFGLVLMLPNLPGYDLPIFKGLSVFAGLVLSIGSVGALSNAFAGISLLLSRGLKEGDRIKVGEHVGDVLEMSFATTRIRTIAKQDVTLPNSYLLQNGVLNMTSPVKEAGSTIVYIAITIGYDAHGDVVADLLTRAALATDGVLADPAPFVLQKSLDDFYVTYHLGAHTQVPEQTLRLVSDLNKNIRKCFDEGGVEIMSPHYSSLRDGACITIPERYRAASYEAPAFRLEASVKPSPPGPGQ